MIIFGPCFFQPDSFQDFKDYKFLKM